MDLWYESIEIAEDHVDIVDDAAAQRVIGILAQIEVIFDIDANGIVNVSAKDKGTGREQHITITSGTTMSESDIERAVKEAAEYEAQDKKRKEAVDTRNEADSMVFQTEKALADVGDKIPEADKATVQADIDRLKELLEKTNPEVMSDGEVDDIKAAKEKLMTDSQSLFQKVYEQAQAAGGPENSGFAGGAGPDMSGFTGGASQGGSTGNGGKDDDIVDADFKEV